MVEIISSGSQTHVTSNKNDAYYTSRLPKRAKVIMILEPGKDPTDVTSYRPISLLPVISKILEKLPLSRLTKELRPQTSIPSH
jgi:hypothetical protein